MRILENRFGNVYKRALEQPFSLLLLLALCSPPSPPPPPLVLWPRALEAPSSQARVARCPGLPPYNTAALAADLMYSILGSVYLVFVRCTVYFILSFPISSCQPKVARSSWWPLLQLQLQPQLCKGHLLLCHFLTHRLCSCIICNMQSVTWSLMVVVTVSSMGFGLTQLQL